MFWKSLPEYTKNFRKDLENTLRDHYALYLVMKIVSRSEIKNLIWGNYCHVVEIGIFNSIFSL